MFRILIAKLRDVPIALNGIALSVITLSGFYHLVHLIILSNILLMIACGLIIIKICKYMLNYDVLISEINDYRQGGYITLFSMFLAVFAHQISTFSKFMATDIWVAAFIIHLLLLICLVMRYCNASAVDKILPSWFIPPIGFIVVGLNAFSPVTNIIAGWVFALAGMAFLPLSVLIVRRQFKVPLNMIELPSMGIYAAPVSLLVLAYLKQSYFKVMPNYLCIMVNLNIICTLISIGALIYCLNRIKFNPSFASFTFPFAIAAVSYYQVQDYYFAFALLTWLSAIIATIMTIYMIWYTLFLKSD